MDVRDPESDVSGAMHAALTLITVDKHAFNKGNIVWTVWQRNHLERCAGVVQQWLMGDMTPEMPSTKDTRADP